MGVISPAWLESGHGFFGGKITVFGGVLDFYLARGRAGRHHRFGTMHHARMLVFGLLIRSFCFFFYFYHHLPFSLF